LVRTVSVGRSCRSIRSRSGACNGDKASETNRKMPVNSACCGLARAGGSWKFRALEGSAWHKRHRKSPVGTSADEDRPLEEQRKAPAAHEFDQLIEPTDAGQGDAVNSYFVGMPETDQSSEGRTETYDAAWEPPPSSEVWLHIYDLGPITGRLNEMVLRQANLGAFHCGIEVLGDEWSFQGFYDAWDDPTISGVVRNEPRLHPAYPYRESVMLGHTPLSEEAVYSIIDKLVEEWPANEYHLVSRNCISFAEFLAQVLGVSEPFPPWVRGAVDACKAPPLEAITNCGWSWFKWWSQRQAEQEALAEMQAAANHHS